MFVVRGRTANGDTVYYTGRAGQGFVSVSLDDVFNYDTLGAAQHRAKVLNNGTLLHGIHFVGVSLAQVEA